MVKYEIMRAGQLNQLRDELELIHPECFEQFVVGVISWYQREITHPTVYFDQESLELKPPNLFNMMEYPNLYAETIFKLFVESDALNLMTEEDREYGAAHDIAVDRFNNISLEGRDFMYDDISKILDGYHLFYSFQDDAYDDIHFYNPYVKEVW